MLYKMLFRLLLWGSSYLVSVTQMAEVLAVEFRAETTTISCYYRKLSGSKARPTCTADNLAAICEPIVYTMWDT
jgi:hypothetical protein